MKTLKKAAVIGAVAYGGYQLGKLSTGYSHWGHHPRGKNITLYFHLISKKIQYFLKKVPFKLIKKILRIWIQ